MDKKIKEYAKRLEQRKNDFEKIFQEARAEASHLILAAKPDIWDDREFTASLRKMNEAAARLNEIREEKEEFELFVIHG